MNLFLISVCLLYMCVSVHTCFVSPNVLRLLGFETYDVRERENYERRKDAYNKKVEEYLEVERQHKKLVAKMFNITLTEDTAIPWGLKQWWEPKEEGEDEWK